MYNLHPVILKHHVLTMSGHHDNVNVSGKKDAYKTVLICSQIWNQLHWFVQFNSIFISSIFKSKSPQQIMSAKVGAANEDLNSSIAVQELSDTVVHVPVLHPIPDDFSCSEIAEKGQVFASVDEFLDHVKTIALSKGCALLHDTMTNQGTSWINGSPL